MNKQLFKDAALYLIAAVGCQWAFNRSQLLALSLLASLLAVLSVGTALVAIIGTVEKK